MTLSIIIPVYNEKKTIELTLKQVFNARISGYNKEVIVIDDGSQDGSGEILQELQKRYGFIYLKYTKNLGKGAAIKTGLKKATGHLVLIHDADLEYDPKDWPALLVEFNNPQVKVVYGSRNINPKRRGYKHYAWGVKFLTGLVNLLFKTKLTDIYTCTKIFRTDVIKSLDLKSNNFDIEAEITVKLLKQNVEILELPINYYPRTRKQGKKIHVRDGVSGLWAIIKFA